MLWSGSRSESGRVESDAMDSAKRHLDAFKWFAGLVGAISAVYGVIEGDFWRFTAAAGYIGFVAAAALGALTASGVLENKPDYQVPAVVGSVLLGAGAHLAFPFRPDELENMGGPNVLSLMGLAFIGIAFVVGVGLYHDWQKSQLPPMKRCPDCANEVLAAANVCQHCSYRFPAVVDG